MYKRIGIIGAGHMGSAMINGWLRADSLELHVLTKNKPQELPVYYYQNQDYQKFLNNIDIVFVAVRPSSWHEIAPILNGCNLTKVSIMAGITIKTLSEVSGPWFRVMPNLPVSNGLGCLGIYSSIEIPNSLIQILSILGMPIILDDEQQIHAFTAVAGSGPAWLWHYADQWITAAISQGLDEEKAQTIVMQTIIGTAAITGETKPKILCKSVTSKGGTTESGLQAINQGIAAAISAATAKSKELAQ